MLGRFKGSREERLRDKSEEMREKMIPIYVAGSPWRGEVHDHHGMVEAFASFDSPSRGGLQGDEELHQAMQLAKLQASDRAWQRGANAIINARFAINTMMPTGYGIAFYGDAVTAEDVSTL